LRTELRRVVEVKLDAGPMSILSNASHRGANRGLHLNQAWMACAIAVSALTLLTVSVFLAVVVFMAASTWLVFAQPGVALRATLKHATPWAYVLVASVSILWSQYPDTTARGAVQFAFTTGAALVLGAALPSNLFLSAMLCGVLPAAIATVFVPRMEMNAGQMAMVGVYGSKNSFAMMQAILVLLSAWIFLDNRQGWIVRLCSFGSFVAGFGLLLLGRSADATISAVAALACSFLAYNVTWFPPRWRSAIIYAAIVSTIVLVSMLFVFVSQFDLVDQALGLMGKDSSISGRTYIWYWAAKMTQQNPLLGTGYQAFWVQGNPYAEEIWAHFEIAGRGGFHFHNLWYESEVELGYPGLIVAFLTIAIITVQSVRWVIQLPNAFSCFFLAYVIFINMRTVVEVDLFGQFNVPWLLFISGWACGNQARAQLQAAIKSNSQRTLV
jgi:exopolysaccharide production protein ExoQ